MAKINLQEVDFPYYKNIENDSNIKKYFNKLKKYKPLCQLSNNKKFLHYTLDFEKETKLLRITDYFSEDERVKCQFSGNISPYDWYQKNKANVLKKLGNNPTYASVDYYIWKNTKVCSNFPVIMAMEVLKTFKVKKWLDPSAGWGDRLIAALAYGCEYHGVDPNLKMQDNYQDIISFFSPTSKSYGITPKPYEKTVVENNYYDLVFTSPPFFDLEDYDSSLTQSHRAYPKLKTWKERFLFPLILKSEKALTKEGHFGLYINNHPTYPNYVKDTMDYINKNTKLEYQGTMSWTLSMNRKRNIYIWKKV